jgi:hypothetical protein
MSEPHRDLVIDTNVIVLYDNPPDDTFRKLFSWLGQTGTLVVSQKLVVEYVGASDKLLAGLIAQLMKDKRLLRIGSQEIKSFKDDHYAYTCNRKDVWHARLVFLSPRKRLVSFDDKLVKDVNGFRKVNKIQPQATKSPKPEFYA